MAEHKALKEALAKWKERPQRPGGRPEERLVPVKASDLLAAAEAAGTPEGDMLAAGACAGDPGREVWVVEEQLERLLGGKHAQHHAEGGKGPVLRRAKGEEGAQ